MIWLPADSAPSKGQILLKLPAASYGKCARCSIFILEKFYSNILSPPSHKGGIFDKGEDVFWGQVRARAEFHAHDFHGIKEQERVS